MMIKTFQIQNLTRPYRVEDKNERTHPSHELELEDPPPYWMPSPPPASYYSNKVETSMQTGPQ